MENNAWYIDEMISALNANIEYLEKEGNDNIKVRNGILFAQIAESYIYEFELEFLQEIQTESEVELRINSESGSGKVLSVNDTKLQIEVDRYFGKVIPQARLIISSIFLLKLLRDKLVEKKDHIVSGSIAEKLFGSEAFDISIDNEYQLPILKPEDTIDEYKEQALRLSLGSQLSFVWGPPGTGKTQLISRLIEAFMSKGLSVLLISHTNMATDEALYKTVKYLRNSSEYKLGQIIRVGDIKKSELGKEFPNVIPINASDAASKPLQQEIDALKKVTNQTEKERDIIKEFLGDHEAYEKSLSDVKKLSDQLDKLIYQLRLSEESKKQNKNKISEINFKIDKFQNSNKVIRLFSGQSLSKLTQEKASILKEKEKLGEKIKTEERNITEFNNEIKKSKSENLKFKNKIKGINYDQAKEDLKLKENSLSNIKSQINELNKELTNISEHIIREAKVIATTLTKSYSEKLILSREYDTIIIDEASMAPLPALYYATSIAKKKAVIIGDFFQLPPVVKHKVLKDRGKSDEQYLLEEQLVEKWLKKDIFALAGIEEGITKGKVPNYLRQLKIQYRMHPEIADLINNLVYERYGNGNFRLKSDLSTKSNGEGGKNKGQR